MEIAVIDQGPELFWFVSNALINDEQLKLKHIKDATIGEKSILHTLPQIVIVNGDDGDLDPIKFITRMRNHVFARNILFIVVTANLTVEFKKNLMFAGAGQVFYRGKGFNPSPTFFASMVKWFLTYKAPDPAVFEFKPTTFTSSEAELTTFGRVGWISSTHVLVESNIDLNPGQTIQCKNSLLEELEIKNATLVCEEKNKIGRYYQYANSLLCKIVSKEPAKDKKNLENWIANNRDISKDKLIKIVYFESDPEYREVIKGIIKFDKHYCARGFASLEGLQEILDYQIPHLVLVNRSIILADKAKFEAMKAFVKNNFCYCVTYANPKLTNEEAPPPPLADFEKDYDFAVHSPGFIELPLLESMVQKLQLKLNDKLKADENKIYFGKHSAYSRINFISPCQIKEIAISGASMSLPFALSNFCACEISSPTFIKANLGRSQFFRNFSSKAGEDSSSIYHRIIFMGQNVKDNASVKETIRSIGEIGFEEWLLKGTSDKV